LSNGGGLSEIEEVAIFCVGAEEEEIGKRDRMSRTE